MTILTPKHIWQETPLIRANQLSKSLNCSVFLKLENLQPSRSFKYRGISLFVQRCKELHGPSVHLVIASGGNAALAAACVAHVLHLQCTVYLPENACPKVREFLMLEGAEVVATGECFEEASQKAKLAVKLDPVKILVPAYDDPLLWLGHSSMISEIATQLSVKPDAIFCSVGGGGLLGGIILGCKEVGWDDVPVVALETTGCDCFYHSISANSDWSNGAEKSLQGCDLIDDTHNGVKLARLRKLSSRVGSLGASSPAPAVVKMALERKGGVDCVSIPDEMSMHAAVKFAEDHHFLVELACSTTLAPAYVPNLFSKLVPPPQLGKSAPGLKGKESVVVFIVCGGVKVSLEDMQEYRGILRDDMKCTTFWDVFCNGDRWSISKCKDKT